MAADKLTHDTPSDSVLELERAIARISYLLTRARRHSRAATEAGVDLERANLPLLRALADAPTPLRAGELAARLEVEAPHITRQVQRLAQAGYVERIPDPHDGRATRISLTPAGMAAFEAIRAVNRRWMEEALATWTPEDLRVLAELNHRMVDDFLTHGTKVQGWDS